MRIGVRVNKQKIKEYVLVRLNVTLTGIRNRKLRKNERNVSRKIVKEEKEERSFVTGVESTNVTVYIHKQTNKQTHTQIDTYANDLSINLFSSLTRKLKMEKMK